MRLKYVHGVAVLLGASMMCAAAFGEQVNSPAYAAWAKFKVGTVVVTKQTSEMAMEGMAPGAGKQEQTTTMKLLEITPDKVVVESTSKMTMNGEEKISPATKLDFPAKVEKGQELIATMGPMEGKPPVVKDVKDGKDTLTVGDKKLDTVTKEFTIESAADDPNKASGTMKIWTAAEIPGGTVKMEMTLTVPLTLKMTQVVTEFTPAK